MSDSPGLLVIFIALVWLLLPFLINSWFKKLDNTQRAIAKSVQAIEAAVQRLAEKKPIPAEPVKLEPDVYKL